MKIATRSWSGVLPISVALEGHQFSCKFDCAFCPNERVSNGATKDIARSYLSTEGTFKRGEVCDFDAAKQVIRRLAELESMNHYPDKLEIIVLGGTWDCYPEEYRASFMRGIFYGANVYTDLSPVLGGTKSYLLKSWLDKSPFVHKIGLDFSPEEIRHPEELDLEKARNQFGKGARIVGVVLETRPDMISKFSMIQVRRLGCTRIQLGIQHTSDMVLDLNNRGHKNKASILAMQKCKDNGFKVDVHVMPDLPFSHSSLDMDMFFRVFRSGDYQPDYVKIYPCLDLPFTQTRKWKEQGIWIPYAEFDYPLFIQTLSYGLSLVPPWTRVNRVHRDFPEASLKNSFLGYESQTVKTNLHQLVKDNMMKKDLVCVDIRSREIKRGNPDFSKARLYLRSYWSGGAKEWFLSLEIPTCKTDPDQASLLGFVRLRLPSIKRPVYHSSLFPLFRKEKWGKIRELHVYGFIAGTKEKETVQHRGVGKFLLRTAESVAFWEGCCGCAVISGVGVRNYYASQGYDLDDGDGEFMTKRFSMYQLVRLFRPYLFLFLWLGEKGWVKKNYGFASANLVVIPSPRIFQYIILLFLLLWVCW